MTSKKCQEKIFYSNGVKDYHLKSILIHMIYDQLLITYLI